MKEVIELIATEIASRDEFHPSEFRGMFGDISEAEFGTAIHDAVDIARTRSRIVFRMRGGVYRKVESSSEIAARSSAFRRSALRKMERSADLIECAIDSSQDASEVASLIKRRARLSDMAFDRAKPSPFAQFKKTGSEGK